MPLLENVQISLKEIVEVRKKSFTESEIWGLLAQGVEAIHHLFLVDRAHKDGLPTNLITPSSYLCTSRGRVYLGACTVDDVKSVNVYFEDQFDSIDVRNHENQIEKAYVYTLGYTLCSVFDGLDWKGTSETIRAKELKNVSPVLVQTLFAMIEPNASKRISITDLSSICQNVAPTFMGGESNSLIIERLYREVIDCLPENDILAYVDQQMAKENEQIIKGCQQNADNESDHNTAKACPVLLTVSGTNDFSKTARHRWHSAFDKVLAHNKIMRKVFDECFTTKEGLSIPIKWQDHEAFNTIIKVYHELLERRKMLELLRLSINLPVDQNKLAAEMVPKSVSDLVLLLRKSSAASQSGDCANETKNALSDSHKPPLVTYLYYQIPGRVDVGPEFLLNSSRTDKNLVVSVDGIDSKVFTCSVILLSGVKCDVQCSGTTTVMEILDAVMKVVNYSAEDRHLVGVALKRCEEYFFLANEKTVIDIQPQSLMHFRFKFYCKNLSFLSNEGTRHQFYLQLRQDLLSVSPNANSYDVLIEIAGYALQAEFGNYSTDFPEPYFLLEHYLPPAVIEDYDRDELKLKLKTCHCCLKGNATNEAELKFIKKAFMLDCFGYLFYRVFLQKRDSSSAVILGICFDGIDVFEERYLQNSRSKMKKRLQSHTWDDIVKISYTDDYFCFTPKLQTITGWHVKYKFYTDDYRGKSLSLFEITVEYHRLHSKLIEQADDKLHKINFDSGVKALLRTQSKSGLEPPKKLMTGVKSLKSRASEVGALVRTQLNSLIGPKQECIRPEREDCNSEDGNKKNDKEEGETEKAIAEARLAQNPGETGINVLIGSETPPTPPKRKKKLLNESRLRNETGGKSGTSEELSSFTEDNSTAMVQRIEQVKRNDNCHLRSTNDKVQYSSDPLGSKKTSHSGTKSSHCPPGGRNGTLQDKETSVLETNHEIILRKSNGTLGLKLLSGKPSPNGSGVYVQSVNAESIAKEEGHLKPGDEIIEVNGAKLKGLDYPSAVKLLKDSPVYCHLTIKRDNQTRSEKLSEESNWMMPSHNHILQLSGSSNSAEDFSFTDFGRAQQDLFSSTADNLCNNNEVDVTTSSYESYASRIPDITFDLIPDLHLNSCQDIYHFLDETNTVRVSLRKNSRGIGVSFCGGVDVKTDNPVESLIRVKRIHPAAPADNSGVIDVGDIIIEANGRSLVGCTKMEAVNTLHSLPDDIELLILKPNLIPSVEQRKVAIPSPSNSFTSCSTPILEEDCELSESIEIEVTLDKINGSLGFTIVKIEGEGFFVKELIKEPAVSNVNIFAGDKILLVNGIDVSSMSHSGAISFLRSLPDTVTLLLLHSSINPLEESLLGSKANRNKKQLRHEARMMLSDKSRLSESPNRLKMRKNRRKSRECLVNPSECDTSDINRNTSRAKSFSSKQEDSDKAVYNNLNNDIDSSFMRQSSVMQNAKVQATVSGKDPCFLRWRGTTLAEDTTDGVFEDSIDKSLYRDEQDSGFGESTSTILKKDVANGNHSAEIVPVTCGYSFHVVLDRRWHGRLGFSLADARDDDDSSQKACVVKAIFPNSVASKDGRIRVGDKLLKVNDESLLNLPAKEVIDNLRKIRGKVDLLFLRNVQQSDL